MKLAIALDRNRTVVEFGYAHFCKRHNTLVDFDHINKCELIKPAKGNVTDIILPLSKVSSIWDLEGDQIKALKKDLTDLNTKLQRLVKENEFVQF